jgi:hypothetical protein
MTNEKLKAAIAAKLREEYTIGNKKVPGAPISWLLRDLRDDGWRKLPALGFFESDVEALGFRVIAGTNRRGGHARVVVERDALEKAPTFAAHEINEHKIEVPDDMEVDNGNTGPGAYDCIRYRGEEICTADEHGQIERGFYTGPFYVGDEAKEVWSLRAARTLIDKKKGA